MWERLRRTQGGRRLVASVSVVLILAGAVAVVTSAGFSSAAVSFPSASAWLLTKTGGNVRATLVDAVAGERVFKPIDLGPGAGEVALVQLPGADPAVVSGIGTGGEIASRLDPASGTKAVSSAVAGLKLFVATGHLVGVDANKGSIVELDPRTLERRHDSATKPAGTGGFHGFGDERGTIWLLNRTSGDVVRVPRGGDPKEVSVIDGDVSNATLTSVGGVPIVVDPNSSTATELNSSSGVPQRRFTFDGRASSVQRPQLHGTSGVASRLHLIVGSKLVIVDPGAQQSQSVELGTPGGVLGSPVVVGRTVYVPDASTGRVHVVRDDTREIVGSPMFLKPGGPIELVPMDRNVLAHDPTAANGFVLGPDGILKYEFQKVDGAAGGTKGDEGDETGGGDPAPNAVAPQPGSAVTPPNPNSPPPSTPPVSSGNQSPTTTNPNPNPGSTTTTTTNPNAPLQASFTFDPPSGQVGTAITFTDTSTGGPTGWQWDFGPPGTSSQQNPPVIYDVSGNFMVSLTVTRAGVPPSTISQTVTVAPLPQLVADFTGPSSGTIGSPVQFADATGGGATSWSWNFDDGSTSTLQSPSHTYNSAATFTVRLTVSRSSDGALDTFSSSITITAAQVTPTANFTTDCNRPDTGFAVQFTWTPQSGVDPNAWTYQWHLDGVGSGGPGGVAVTQAQQSYTSPGQHTIILEIYDGSPVGTPPPNLIDTKSITIDVQSSGVVQGPPGCNG